MSTPIQKKYRFSPQSYYEVRNLSFYFLLHCHCLIVFFRQVWQNWWFNPHKKYKFVGPFRKPKGLKIAANAIYTTLQQDSVVLVQTPTVVPTILNIVTRFTTKFSIQRDDSVLNLVLNLVLFSTTLYVVLNLVPEVWPY